MTIIVNEDHCRKDGICTEICPTRFIKGRVGTVPAGREGLAFCISCGHCMAFCPHEAITVEKFGDLPAVKFNRKALPTTEQVELLCTSRRSTRVFKDTPVDRSLVQHLINKAGYAPTGKNMRNLRHILFYDTEKLEEFAEVLVSALEKKLANSSDPVIVENASLVRSFRAGRDPMFRKAPHLLLTVAPKNWMWKEVDSAIFLTYFELLGHAHGLGLCWAGYICRATCMLPEVREFLGIGDDEELCGGQLFGLPKFRVQAIPPRLPYPTDWR